MHTTMKFCRNPMLVDYSIFTLNLLQLCCCSLFSYKSITNQKTKFLVEDLNPEVHHVTAHIRIMGKKSNDSDSEESKTEYDPPGLISFGSSPSTLLHSFIVLFVNCYKFIEKKFLLAIYPHLRLFVKSKLKIGDIRTNGRRDWDIKPYDEKEFFIRVANNPSLGLGETYMEGIWDCRNLDECLYRIFKHNVYKEYLNIINRSINYMLFQVCNLQTKKRVWEVGERHYDLGNDLFEAMLDPAMNYSCGYWRRASNLTDAQIHKMKLIGDKLQLRPGMKVLDIGCGWAGLCKYLASEYGVSVVGITISKEQADIGMSRCAGLPVDIQLIDYRDVQEKFDRIVSVGMFEHVGPANYKDFFGVAKRCLKDDGLFLLHTIGVADPSVPRIEPWFHKYIFPNGILPLETDITKYCHGLFIIEDWHNFSNDYAKTLRAWRDNFKGAWPRTLEAKYGPTFYRMWDFYLSLCIGAFRSRKYQLWQIVLSPNGVEGGYESVR